jgi:hypothetical protein
VLELSAGGEALRIAGDPQTAVVSYARPVVVPDVRLEIAAAGPAIVLSWSGLTNALLQQSLLLPSTNWSTIPLPPGATSHTQAVSGAQSFFRLLIR